MDTKALAKKIRLHALEMVSTGGSAHIGSIMSVADIVAVLYGSVLNVDPKKPTWDERDRFILSKGHAGASVYAALASRGFFAESLLKKHYQNGSVLSGHVSHKGVPGVEWSTGSLGHGLSVAVGIAKAAKLDGKKYRVFVVLSDGECDEGTTWEAALSAAQHKLDNLTVVIDYNKTQCYGLKKDVIDIEPLTEKWESFNWAVQEVDGHGHGALENALKGVPFSRGKPSVVIAHTRRGKGVSFMEENAILWYYRTPRGEEYEKARKELSKDHA